MAISAAAASLIGAGISAVGAGGTTVFNAAQTKKQREWSEKMTGQQNAWNLEMWNKTNEYNSPAAQLERMREAGLNPLYYGLDGSSAGSLESAQPLGYERANMSAADNPISAGIDAALRIAQINNVQADTAKKGEETLTEVQKREKMQAEISNVQQELNNLKAQEGLTKKQTEQIDKTLEWTDRLNEAVVAEKEASAALSQAQKQRVEELLEGEKLIQAKTIEDFDRRWSKITAEIAKMAKETGLLAKDIENYALNHASNGFMGTGLSLQNFVRAIKNSSIPKTDYTNTDAITDTFGNGD